MIKVLIVDDQKLIREGLNMMLSLYDDIEAIGEATNGEEAIQKVEETDVDVILMDIRMPVMDGVVATGKIKEKYPHIKILVLTTFNEDEYIFQGLKNGADGYVLKDVSSEELVNDIKAIYQGHILLQQEVAAKVIGTFNSKKIEKKGKSNKENIFEQLTFREKEIAQLIAEGKSNKEISKTLYITEGTVKNHITKILDKLELRDRTQLALFINDK